MPITARVTVKLSLVYLVIGFLLGALLLTNRWIPLGSVAGLVRTPTSTCSSSAGSPS